MGQPSELLQILNASLQYNLQKEENTKSRGLDLAKMVLAKKEAETSRKFRASESEKSRKFQAEQEAKRVAMNTLNAQLERYYKLSDEYTKELSHLKSLTKKAGKFKDLTPGMMKVIGVASNEGLGRVEDIRDRLSAINSNVSSLMNQLSEVRKTTADYEYGYGQLGTMAYDYARKHDTSGSLADDFIVNAKEKAWAKDAINTIPGLENLKVNDAMIAGMNAKFDELWKDRFTAANSEAKAEAAANKVTKTKISKGYADRYRGYYAANANLDKALEGEITANGRYAMVNMDRAVEDPSAASRTTARNFMQLIDDNSNSLDDTYGRYVGLYKEYIDAGDTDSALNIAEAAMQYAYENKDSVIGNVDDVPGLFWNNNTEDFKEYAGNMMEGWKALKEMEAAQVDMNLDKAKNDAYIEDNPVDKDKDGKPKQTKPVKSTKPNKEGELRVDPNKLKELKNKAEQSNTVEYQASKPVSSNEKKLANKYFGYDIKKVKTAEDAHDLINKLKSTYSIGASKSQKDARKAAIKLLYKKQLELSNKENAGYLAKGKEYGYKYMPTILKDKEYKKYLDSAVAGLEDSSIDDIKAILIKFGKKPSGRARDKIAVAAALKVLKARNK